MRYSRGFLPTLKEDPAEAEVVSHSLMVRAGIIRRVAAGIYNLLPLGLRIQKKVESIVRDEMDRAGAQEVLLPVMLPSGFWEETGRWQAYGKELIRLRDRHGRDFCLGPTHEEIITDMIRRDVRSYRDLPLNLYQIQTKFRDEIRPRFGVMRGREFVMKDAYSFDTDEKGAEESYQIMFNAYRRIFTRCGLQYSPVEADSGLIGGSFSHEFMVHAETGEESITICNECGYSANVELTPLSRSLEKPSFSKIKDGKTSLRKVHTPCISTAEEVAGFFKRNLSDITKTLVYSSDGLPIVVMVRGDYFINETKLKNYLQSAELILAGEEMTQQVTNARVGFAGPINLRGNVRIVGDFSVMEQSNLVLGANEDDHHFEGATIGKDFEISEFADIRAAVEGDPCPKCKAPLGVMKGIEVGHVFKLGTKYSEAMGTRFLGEDGELRTVVMGCYGIGIGRTIAAAIEQNHDENGIIWPVPIAPYHVVIIPIKYDDPDTQEITENLYQTLSDNSIEVLLDDREERPGVKFKDADLMGIPFQVIVGPKGLVDGKVELKARRGGSKDLIALTEAEKFVQSKIQEEMSAACPERLGI